MFVRTDLDLLQKHTREEVVEIATNNIVNELVRLASTFKKVMKTIVINYYNNVISINIITNDGNETKTHYFTREVHQFDIDDAMSLHAKIKVAMKKYNVKTIYNTDVIKG